MLFVVGKSNVNSHERFFFGRVESFSQLIQINEGRKNWLTGVLLLIAGFSRAVRCSEF